MHQGPERLPDGVDLEKASVARCYDYSLGGAHNFAVDRAVVRRIVQADPRARDLAQLNRAFLSRAVRYCLQQGIRQFLDLGSGIPTVGNVHEIAQHTDPCARVVYVDNDPVAIAHSRTILEGNELADVVHADMTDVAAVLHSPQVARVLRFNEPIGLIMAAVLHHVTDEQEPHKVLRQYHDRIAPGSLLCVSHLARDVLPDSARRIAEAFTEGDRVLLARGGAELTALLADFEFVEPGLVHVPEWRPESREDGCAPPQDSLLYGVVGRKRTVRHRDEGDPR